MANDKSVPKAVPEASVIKEGHPVPTAPVRSAGEATPLTAASTYNDDVTPRGMWKDGLCDCCAFGPCHPHLCNALFCPQLLMAQVLTRMNMNWLGRRNSSDYQNTFKKVFFIIIAYWVLGTILAPPQPVVEISGDDMNHDVKVIQPDVPFYQDFSYRLLNAAFTLYSLIVLIKLRRAVRDRYLIPSQSCFGEPTEDCCVSFFCGCCTVAQLARHTANYQERRAVCCSSTGLPPNPPTAMVV